MNSTIVAVLVLIHTINYIDASCQDLPPPPILKEEDYITSEFQGICDLNNKSDFYKKYSSVEFYKVNSIDTSLILKRNFRYKKDSIVFNSLQSKMTIKGVETDSVFIISLGDTTLNSIIFYDREGKEVENIIFDKAGNRSFRNRKEYDSSKRIIGEYAIQIFPDKEFTYESTKITYKRDGSKITTRKNHFAELYGADPIVETFNRFGQKIKIEIFKNKMLFSSTELTCWL